MDAALLTAQATAALTSLTSQLSTLTQQQTALLDSLRLTNATASSLPFYSQISPTFTAIPQYQKKLDRLRKTMVMQQQEVDALKRRATEVARRRRENLGRLAERRREEGERDRTVLRARVEGDDRAGERAGAGASAAEGRASPKPVKVVKKRKKARKVEIE